MDVDIRCICPPRADGKPRHDKDTVKLKEKLTFDDLAIYLAQAQVAAGDTVEMLAGLKKRHLYIGIEAWSLVDAKGYALPVDRETIDDVLMPNLDVALYLANMADNEYMPVVLPLLTRGTASWRPGQTEDSTPPTSSEAGESPTPTPADQSNQSSSGKSPKPSKRSSTTSTPTAVTGTMQESPVVVSSTWPS